MSGICACCRSSVEELGDSEVKEDDEETKEDVKTQGFVKADRRKCTDIFCLGIWIAHLVLFVIVTFYGMKDGNPHNLYRPRDTQGAYCGTETNWNNGPNLASQTKQSYTMNVTHTTDIIAKQFMCSTAAKDFLLASSGLSAADKLEYQSECCLIPAPHCTGSLALGGDIAGTLSAANMDTIRQRMADLTNFNNAFSLWSTSGANGGIFTDIWSRANEYFVKTCLPSCTMDIASLNGTAARTYTYKPAPDQKLRKAWDLLDARFNATPFMDAFKFSALPPSVCPYDAEFCVPFPGVEFRELSNGYCTFKMGTDVINAVGSTMASGFQSLGGDSFVESATETLGAWWGDFEKSADTFALVCVCCFVVGFVYLVILRFTVKVCVWSAIALVFLALVLGGAFAWVRHTQCQGVGLFDTASQTGTAVVIATTSAASNLVNGGATASEDCTGDCADYRGQQTRTRSGKLCQAWAQDTPHNHTYKAALYPSSGLANINGFQHNYCRNPYHANDTYKASTIWCFTTESETRWELCTPIGILTPACPNGYAVSGENMRKVLEICAYVIWGLSAVWLICIFFLFNRIRLAIALNSVAAQFLSHTPSVLVVPVIQAVICALWTAAWAFSAAFLLSQVPDNYTPTEAYATYAEAYGTADTAGACTGKWPTGIVYKAPSGQCDMSNPTVPKCWKCAPPRYIFDLRFAASFFSFLWNNALLIAFGQCVIAGAVGVWFFTPNSDKGKWKVKALRTANANVWRFHFGSLAFGSFVLATIQFLRYLMYWLQRNAEAQKNRVMAVIARALQCCLWCFERFIQFLNKNAYIQIAIRGTSFCRSARKAFQIILQNVLRFGTVAVLGSVIESIGYLFIMAATLVIGYFALRWMHEDISPVIPMIVYGFMSYVVGKLFMNVFSLAVDTCLQCVIFAEEKYPGADIVPKSLEKIMDKTKRGEDPADDSKQ